MKIAILPGIPEYFVSIAGTKLSKTCFHCIQLFRAAAYGIFTEAEIKGNWIDVR